MLLILVILLTTIFFCHALISLCVVAIHAPNEERPRMSLIGPGGFANPPRPIPVALARDEEAAGIESEATRFPPPAYGLWRESVVCIASSISSQKLLIIHRELTQIASSGSARQQQGHIIHNFQERLKQILGLRGLRPISLKMAWLM